MACCVLLHATEPVSRESALAHSMPQTWLRPDVRASYAVMGRGATPASRAAQVPAGATDSEVLAVLRASTLPLPRASAAAILERRAIQAVPLDPPQKQFPPQDVLGPLPRAAQAAGSAEPRAGGGASAAPGAAAGQLRSPGTAGPGVQQAADGRSVSGAVSASEGEGQPEGSGDAAAADPGAAGAARSGPRREAERRAAYAAMAGAGGAAGGAGESPAAAALQAAARAPRGEDPLAALRGRLAADRGEGGGAGPSKPAPDEAAAAAAARKAPTSDDGGADIYSRRQRPRPAGAPGARASGQPAAAPAPAPAAAAAARQPRASAVRAAPRTGSGASALDPPTCGRVGISVHRACAGVAR